jgi:hypothetical protein
MSRRLRISSTRLATICLVVMLSTLPQHDGVDAKTVAGPVIPAPAPVPKGATVVAHSPVLPRKLDAMKGTEFWDWAEGPTGPDSARAPQERERYCKGTPECASHVKKTLVSIDAVVDGHKLNLNKNIPANGVVVARLSIKKIQQGGKHPPERRYGLINDEFQYYIVVENVPKTGTQDRVHRWRLVEVDVEKTHMVTLTGTFRRCYPPESQSKPKADFTECSNRAGMHASYERAVEVLRNARTPGDSARAQAAILRILINPEFGPAWVACTHGCCIADT